MESLKAELHRFGAVIKGLQRDVNGWAIRYRLLEEDKAVEAREHALWPVAKRLFDSWRFMCRHPNSKWSPDRFWLIETFLTQPRYAPDLHGRVVLCCRAIMGARYDPWTVKRRNGSVKRMDEWERIFGAPDRWRKTSSSAGSFEEFCNRAPRDWRPTLSPGLVEAIAVAEARLKAAKL